LAHAKDEKTNTASRGTYIFAEDQQVAVNALTPSDYAVTAKVTDGTLTIGYRGVNCNANWAACDNFRISSFDPDAEYTVTFYEEDKTTVVDTRKVKVGTNYCVNDIPDVPAKPGRCENGKIFIYVKNAATSFMVRPRLRAIAGRLAQLPGAPRRIDLRLEIHSR
jgi:hypothetical protein